MEIENSSSIISKIDSKDKDVIRLDKCYFSKLKECPNPEVLNYYYCFLAITEDNGLFRKLCDDNSGNNERSLNWLFMKDLKMVAIEKKQKEKKIVLFLLLKETTDIDIVSMRCDNLFNKTFKYFFPSDRTSYASVGQKEERAKYRLISNGLKKECTEMNDFLLLFEEHHYSGFRFNNDSRLELMKKDCSLMKKFNQIIFSFFFYGKTLKNQIWELDLVEIISMKEDLIKIGMTIDCAYEDEKPIMLKKLDLFEKSSHKGIYVDPKDFKRSLSHDYVTAERFIKENKKRFRSISNRASKYSKSPSILVNDSKIIFDKNGVIDEEEMKKGEKILEITTKTRTSKVLIKYFYSDCENFDKVNHVFVDASWINKYMIVPITTMIKIDKNQIPEEEPPYWIYKTVMIFFIEGEVLLENELKKCSPKGTNDLYNYIFEVVKSKCINLKSVSSDFEAAILNGIDSQKLQRWGCYFHYIQRLRTNCSENHYLLSNQCLSVLKILPFVNLSIGKHRKRNLDELQKIFDHHKPDLEMFKYVRRQYLNSPKVFNRKIVINQSEAEREIEYFKFTDNASERVFKILKSSIVKGTKTCIDKQYIIERILHYLKRQKNSYVGGRNRETKFKFVKSDLGYFFRHGMEEFERRKKLYLDALEQDHLEGIKLVTKTFKDALGNDAKIWTEKKKRKRIDKIPIKLQEIDSSFEEYASKSNHSYREANICEQFKPIITTTRSNVSKTLTKRDRSTAFSAREKAVFGTKISTLTDEELRRFKRIKIFEDDSTKVISLKLNKTESKLKDIEKIVKLEKERRENEGKLRELEKVELERQRKLDQEQREREKAEFECQIKFDKEQRELEKAEFIQKMELERANERKEIERWENKFKEEFEKRLKEELEKFVRVAQIQKIQNNYSINDDPSYQKDMILTHGQETISIPDQNNVNLSIGNHFSLQKEIKVIMKQKEKRIISNNIMGSKKPPGNKAQQKAKKAKKAADSRIKKE